MSTVVTAPIHTTREEIEALRKVLYAQRTQAQRMKENWIGRGVDRLSSIVSCGVMFDNLCRKHDPIFTGLGLIAGVYVACKMASVKPEKIESLVTRCCQENLDIEKKEIIKKIVKKQFSLNHRPVLSHLYLTSLCTSIALNYIMRNPSTPLVVINDLAIGFFGFVSAFRIMEMASELCAAKSNIVEELQKEIQLAESQSSRTNIHTDKH